MEMSYDDREFWQFSDQLRLQTAANDFSSLSIADSIWSPPPLDDCNMLPAYKGSSATNRNVSPGLIGSRKLAFANSTTNNADRYNYFPAAKSDTHKPNNDNNSSSYYYNDKQINNNNNSFTNSAGDAAAVKSYFNKSVGRPASNSNNNTIGGAYGQGKLKSGDVGVGVGGRKNSNGFVRNNNSNGLVDNKRFKSLPAAEALPKNESVGGYIFVCNNDTMEENLKRQLFGLPSRYRDSVRAIRPGLPLFLYNYSTHQLHGIFEAASFGGSNIDPTAWEDNKHSDSRFPAQVRVATRKICEPLEEDAFRPILHHYDGPKFRLELSVAEAISLLDIFAEKLFA